MSRIYSVKHPVLFKRRKDGDYYTFIGQKETWLKTNDPRVALANREYIIATREALGPKSFEFPIGNLFPRFLESKKYEVRFSTLNSYEKLWSGGLKRFWAKRSLAEVHQATWLEYCRRNDSVRAFQNHRNLMHQFLVWCEMNRFLRAIPTLKNPKHKGRKRKIIPPEHLSVIFQEASGSLQLFLSLYLFMGMRRLEIISLPWDKVNLIKRTITLDDKSVKTGDGREVPINSIVYGLLLKRRSEQRIKTRWVFPNALDEERHADPGGLKTAWQTCMGRAGLAIRATGKRNRKYWKAIYTWHDFRATFEKHMHRSNEFTDTQKEKMVGADIDVQKRVYVTMDADDLRGLEEVVTKAIPELAGIITGPALDGNRKFKNAKHLNS